MNARSSSWCQRALAGVEDATMADTMGICLHARVSPAALRQLARRGLVRAPTDVNGAWQLTDAGRAARAGAR